MVLVMCGMRMRPWFVAPMLNCWKTIDWVDAWSLLWLVLVLVPMLGFAMFMVCMVVGTITCMVMRLAAR